MLGIFLAGMLFVERSAAQGFVCRLSGPWAAHEFGRHDFGLVLGLHEFALGKFVTPPSAKPKSGNIEEMRLSFSCKKRKGRGHF